MATLEQKINSETGKTLVTDAERALWNTKNLSNNPKGAWNASTNSPTLTTTPSAAGDVYDVTVAGTQSVTGSSVAFVAGDQLKSDGTAWYRIPAVGVLDKSITTAKLSDTIAAPIHVGGVAGSPSAQNVVGGFQALAGEILLGVTEDGTPVGPGIMVMKAAATAAQAAADAAQATANSANTTASAAQTQVSSIASKQVAGTAGGGVYLSFSGGTAVKILNEDGTTVTDPAILAQITSAAAVAAAAQSTANAAVVTKQVTGGTTTGGVYLSFSDGNAVKILSEDGSLVTDPATLARIVALESLTATKTTVEIVMVDGQSNAQGAINFSQNWRTPMNWGAYPPGYSGELDGASILNSAQSNNTRTMNATRDGFFRYFDNITGITGSGLHHGMIDSIANSYPNQQFVVMGHAVGGRTIAYLDKPTSAEITAGSASGLSIPNTSGEYLLQTAGKAITSILDYDFLLYVSSYYQGMWLIAKMVQLVLAEGKVPKVTALCWLQGETDSDNGNATYNTQLLAFYDDYANDVTRLTGQADRMNMLIEETNYSSQLDQPGFAGYDTWVANSYSAAYDIGGASTQYTLEANRVNSNFALNLLQLLATKDGPYSSPRRNIYLVSPRYYLTNRVHMTPHGHRQHGEQYGKVYRKIVYEKQNWLPLHPLGWWRDATSVYIRFHVPKGPLQFQLSTNITTHNLKTGKPYGFEHSAGSIQQENVQVMGNDTLRITPDVAPIAGHTISYVNSVRFGSLCDSDPTPGIYTDRAGSAYVLRNYCIPFSITL